MLSRKHINTCQTRKEIKLSHLLCESRSALTIGARRKMMYDSLRAWKKEETTEREPFLIIPIPGMRGSWILYPWQLPQNTSPVNGSIFPALVLSLYCTYLCYRALASEPRDYECNSLHHSKAVSTGTLTIGLLTTVFSVIYSAVRAGSSTTLLSPPSSPRAGAGKPLLPLDKADEEEKKEKAKTVTYSYSFFHIIFCLASMYSAMLLTGWSTSVGESGKLVDVGWPSVWVKLVTGWATAALFIWSQVAPILFPEREF